MNIFVFLLACISSETPSSETPRTTPSNASDSPPQKIQATKILINAEMRHPLQEMDQLIRNFQGTDLNSYQNLGIMLTKKNDQLALSCTMEGEDHEILHDWLIPHIDLIEKLKKASDITDAQKQLQNLRKSMEHFHQQFAG